MCRPLFNRAVTLVLVASHAYDTQVHLNCCLKSQILTVRTWQDRSKNQVAAGPLHAPKAARHFSQLVQVIVCELKTASWLAHIWSQGPGTPPTRLPASHTLLTPAAARLGAAVPPAPRPRGSVRGRPRPPDGPCQAHRRHLAAASVRAPCQAAKPPVPVHASQYF